MAVRFESTPITIAPDQGYEEFQKSVDKQYADEIKRFEKKLRQLRSGRHNEDLEAFKKHMEDTAKR